MPGKAEASREEIRRNNADALPGKDSGEEETNGTLTGDEDGVVREKGEATDALQQRVDGFEEGSFEEGVSTGNLHHAGKAEGHDADVLGIATTGGFESGGDPGAAIGFALGESAMSAEMAVETGNMVMECDTFAGLEAADCRPDPDDGPAGFVTKDAGWRDGALVDLLDIGWADATGGDADQDLIAADGGNRDGFNLEEVGTAIDDGLHGFRDGSIVHGFGCGSG